MNESRSHSFRTRTLVGRAILFPLALVKSNNSHASVHPSPDFEDKESHLRADENGIRRKELVPDTGLLQFDNSKLAAHVPVMPEPFPQQRSSPIH